MGNIGISIGANPESIKSLADAVTSILYASVSDLVKVKALETLQVCSKVENTTVKDCIISMKPENQEKEAE